MRYKEFHLDSRLPFNATPKVCIAPGAGRLASLDIHASCYVQIRADERLSRVPLQVRRNENYDLAMLKNQAWFDKANRVDSAEGFDGSPLMNVFKTLKRDSASNWMALVAAVVDTDCGDAPALQFTWLKTAGTTLAVQHDGQMAFFPNDADGSYNFYSNNSGLVWIRVTRMPDSGLVGTMPQVRCQEF